MYLENPSSECMLMGFQFKSILMVNNYNQVNYQYSINTIVCKGSSFGVI